MRICHIITGLEVGGAETLLVNCCNILAINHEICILYYKGNGKIVPLFDPKISIVKIELNSKVVSTTRAFLKDWKPDVVHTHLSHADFIGLWCARDVQAKLFCTMHNVSFKKDWRDVLIFKAYRLLLTKLVASCRVICISKSVKEHVVKVLKVKSSNAILLYNAVPKLIEKYTREDARQSLAIKQDKFVILFVGRLEKQKALHVLINAIPSLVRTIKNLQVEIIGTGSQLDSLKELAKELNVENYLFFRGNTFNVTPYFFASDVFVLPSIFEGLGIVILEAFRSGLPVIASNLEGPSELIQNRKNGLLFEKGDSNALSNLLLEVYSDKSLKNHLSQGSNESFSDQFEINSYVQTLEKLYQI